jgi:hypothetical protein
MISKMLLVISAAVISLACNSVCAYGKAVPSHSRHASKAVKKESDSDRAMDLVWKVKEVKVWLNEFGPKRFNPATSGHPAMGIEGHHGAVYIVNAFEDMPDHVVTFGRYEVNVNTGRVKKVD